MPLLEIEIELRLSNPQSALIPAHSALQ